MSELRGYLIVIAFVGVCILVALILHWQSVAELYYPINE